MDREGASQAVNVKMNILIYTYTVQMDKQEDEGGVITILS